MKEQKNNQTNKTKRQSIKQTKTRHKNPTNRGTADPAEFSVLYFICKMLNFHVLC